jgi:hypothetical protein
MAQAAEFLCSKHKAPRLNRSAQKTKQNKQWSSTWEAEAGGL